MLENVTVVKILQNNSFISLILQYTIYCLLLQYIAIAIISLLNIKELYIDSMKFFKL